MKKNLSPFKKRFTLLELLVVISIISVLTTLLSPLLSTAREKARRVSCQNNMRSIGQTLLVYAGENSEHLPLSALGGSVANHDSLEIFPIPSGFVRDSKFNKNVYLPSYIALHHINLLREPKVYKCPSRGSHDVSNDVYNNNIHTFLALAPGLPGATAKGTGTIGADQEQCELSYPYFPNDDFDRPTMDNTVLNIAKLHSSLYGGETSLVRDRVANHGGYNYGNVLYGDGHVESKEISGGQLSGTSTFNDSWLTYHFLDFLIATGNPATFYTPVGDAYEGNSQGLGPIGQATIRFYSNGISVIDLDRENTFGNPPHSP